MSRVCVCFLGRRAEEKWGGGEERWGGREERREEGKAKMGRWGGCGV